jgi:hypothetical protein
MLVGDGSAFRRQGLVRDLGLPSDLPGALGTLVPLSYFTSGHEVNSFSLLHTTPPPTTGHLATGPKEQDHGRKPPLYKVIISGVC